MYKRQFYGTFETLENAIKGGRINPLAGKIIGALNFKAIVQIKDGVVKPIDKARGESNSIKKVANYITSSIEDTKDKILCLMHANCPEKAHKLLSIIEDVYKRQIIESEQNFKEISFTVSSLRLDSVIGGVYNLSRSESLKLIKGEKVHVAVSYTHLS